MLYVENLIPDVDMKISNIHSTNTIRLKNVSFIIIIIVYLINELQLMLPSLGASIYSNSRFLLWSVSSHVISHPTITSIHHQHHGATPWID